MSAADRAAMDRLFNSAWSGASPAERRLRPSVSGDGSWASVGLADGRALVAGVESIGALDRIRTRPPYYVRSAAGAAPEPVTSASQAAELWGGFL